MMSGTQGKHAEVLHNNGFEQHNLLNFFRWASALLHTVLTTDVFVSIHITGCMCILAP